MAFFFLSSKWLGTIFLPSLPVADNVHNSRAECCEVVSYTNYGLHTADVAATGVLLLQNHSRPRPRRKLVVLCPEVVLLQRRTAVATARAATATTIKEAALGYASHICCPHEQAVSMGQRVCRDGSVRDFCEP